MRTEPALRFWLDAVARQGALLEERADATLVLLPSDLQAALSLPEEVLVTDDPTVAQEDGALLLIPGHPLVDQGVDAVLREGDAGYRYLPWPHALPPDPSALLGRARASVIVEHGRLDPAGEPVPVRLPLFRVGALVRYTLGDRLQEREEVWIDAWSRTELAPPPVPVAPEAGAGEREADLAACLAPDVAATLAAADAALTARVARREENLARDVQPDRVRERDQAEVYYADVLASIERRRAAAPPERQALYEAQAEATRAERARRLREIDERFRPRHEIVPFRLHMLLAPALYVPLVVRRGERRFALALVWLIEARTFLPPRCPSCDALSPLVAGRDRLGCATCLPPAAVAAGGGRADDAGDAGEVASATAAARTGEVAPARASGTDAPPPAPAPAARRSGAAAPAAAPVRAAGEEDGAYARVAERVLRLSRRVAVDFWSDPSWRVRHTAANSPLAALQRLYGDPGVLAAVGLPAGREPERVGADTVVPDRHGYTVTTGELFLGERDRLGFAFTILWRLREHQPEFFEVVPFERAGWRLRPMSDLRPEVRSRLTTAPRPPRVALDPVAAVLWRECLAVEGLPLVLRCLGAWWSHGAAGDGADAREVAVALVDAIGRQAGLRRTRAATAALYGLEPARLEAAARAVRALVRAGAPPQ